MGNNVLYIRAITAADLVTLEPLLRASFGRDDFKLSDELEAVAERQPQDWFALYSDRPGGFIRYFPLNKNLYMGELYVVPGPERTGRLERLLRHFIQHHTLPAPATLRLDALGTDHELMDMLRSLFPTALTKTFAHYQLRTPARVREISEVQTLTETGLEATQAILAQLKPYSVRELAGLAATEQLYVAKDNGVKAALHAAPNGTGLEIVTLATAQAHLRRGYAAALLKTFLDANPDTDVALKVGSENTAAVRLYKRGGFTRQASRTEVWWYLRLDL